MEIADFRDYSPASDGVDKQMLFQMERLEVFILQIPAGHTIPPHQHPNRHIFIQTISGRVTVTGGKRVYPTDGRQLIWAHGHEWISLTNETQENASVLIFAHRTEGE